MLVSGYIAWYNAARRGNNSFATTTCALFNSCRHASATPILANSDTILILNQCLLLNNYSLSSTSKSFILTSRTFAILFKVCSVGWVVFEHHLLIVTGETPSWSASQTPVLIFSTRTTFIRFNCLCFMLNYLNDNAKVLIIFGIKKTYSYYLWFYNDLGFGKTLLLTKCNP